MQYWKRFKYYFAPIFLLMGFSSNTQAQELLFNVVVNADQINSTDRRVFTDMEKTFSEFLNNTQWSEDDFQGHERIYGNLILTIEKMPSLGAYQGTVQVQASRPVYNTNYESVLLNFADRQWSFNYVESQPMDFVENVFTTNLTSMLAFYAYITLGLDYDSFSKQGGNPYFRKARNIAQRAQQENNLIGWGAFENNRNRYWLIEDLLNQQMEGVRNAYYTYHRTGMDLFVEKPEEARKNILEALKEVQSADKLKANSIVVRSFFDAKRDELANIFSEGELPVKREAYNILTQLDPTNKEKYEKILKK
ncbi:DUF4835 family protein [Xanthovirga aplysinae]|uniref:type IX secretion system protein PorD n=1 Tax=Xanthovirga aplysinae TaxID=2529853 RepID=UPI0012BB763E|nr:DUF4835 family protein [Xanthovirga aplysinae]MTI31809.1 DUF4835 family protein [Xanthovirga aplysinae]